MITHYWARCDHPSNCGWESACFTSRGAAAGIAGTHKRMHEREGMQPGVRAAVTIRSHDAAADRPGYCLAEKVPA